MNGPGTGTSVIVPTCGRPHLVGDAIESVLGQQAGALELIVVDAGTGRETEDVVRTFGPAVHYLRHEGLSPAAARNRGLEQATGAFLAFLDDDDIWSPDALVVQHRKLAEDPAADIVLGLTQRMVLRKNPAGKPVFTNYKDPTRLHSLGCGLFRRPVFDRVGPLDETMRHAEDDDWFMRARGLGVTLRFLEQVTLYYRFHGANMSTDKQAKMPDMLRLVKNRLDRMRKSREDS